MTVQRKKTPLDRRIEILKILQDKKMTTQELADYFRDANSCSMDTRTIRKDLEALRDGLDVF